MQPNTYDRRDAWLLLATVDALHPRECRTLIDNIGGYSALLNVAQETLIHEGNIDIKLASHIIKNRISFPLNTLKEKLKKYAISCVTWEDDSYPHLLREIYDPPKVLYYRGTLPDPHQTLLAVVGARKMTAYGKTAIAALLPKIIASGIGIVSGLAYGIDSEAHKAALAETGYTCGIIGSGLDPRSFYPQANYLLAQAIVEKGGCVISEFAPNVPPLQHHFPLRNRVIAGLSHGTLVIEAAEKSGSLITAAVALNENREVMAVPGPITSLSNSGTNNLIKQGAQLVTDPNDILAVLGIDNTLFPETVHIKNTDPILALLAEEQRHVDALAHELNLTVQKVSARLSELEIKGLVKNIGGNTYILIK